MTEAQIQAAIQLDLGRGETRIWRNSVGQGWTGDVKGRLPDGAVILGNARPVRFGLCDGSGDLIGVRRIVVSPADVGRTLGLFLSVEVKSATGRPAQNQLAWASMLHSFGALAGVARSVEDARAVAGLGLLP